MGRKAILAVIGGILVLAFQNCNQRGEIALYQNQNKLSFSDGNLVTTGTEDTDIGDGDLIEHNDDDPTAENPGSTPGTTPGSEEDVQSKITGPCKNADSAMSDILLLVRQAKLQGAQSSELKILDEEAQLSVEDSTLEIEATADMVISGLRLVLEEAGNKVLFEDESLSELKTPSGQSSGLKLKLKDSVSLKAGQKADLKIESDLLAAVHPAGKKCILHPVLNASVTVK